MTMQGNWLSTSLPENKYRYNGIEQTTALGLDVYNAFYRTLDPSLARWWQVDPAAEKYNGLTPYNSMGNNPISYNDPNGDDFGLSLLIGAGIGLVMNGIGNVTQNKNFFQGGFEAAIIGAIGAGISSSIGHAFGSVGSFGHELGRAGAHSLSGGFQSALAGGGFGKVH